MSIPLGLVDAWLRPQPGPQPGPVDCGNALWELVEGINAEFGLELDMDSLLSGADGGSSLAALAESVGSALGLQPKPEPEPERRTCPVDLPLERPAADGPPHELAAWRPGQSESDTWQVEEAFRRGQVAMIRVLPTLEMRLAAARATLLAATNAYLPRGLMRAQETPLNDNRRLEVILLEHIEGGGKTPINDTGGSDEYKRLAGQDAIETPLDGHPGGQVDKPLPRFIQIPITSIIATIVPVLSFVVPGLPAGFILAQTFLAHLRETPQAFSPAALRDASLMVLAYVTFGICQGLWAVLFKWLVMGRYKPGRYSLWGWYHIRWWCVNTAVSQASIWVPDFPVWHRFLLALGGTRISRDVKGLGFTTVPEMGLLSVGRVSNFGGGVTIRTASFEPGTLVLRPVRVGERCSIGANAVLGGGCDLGDDVQVKPFTVVDNGTILRAESSSLSNADAEPDDTYAEEGRLQKQAPSLPRTAGSPSQEPGSLTQTFWTATYALLLATSAVACLQPCVALVHVLSAGYPEAHPVVWGMLLVGLYYVFMTLMIGASVCVKWALLGKVKPRLFHPSGCFAMRRFLVNRFIRFVIGSIAYHHLRTTFLKSWIIRMYGGRIAKQVFGHVFPCADIDLLTFRGGSVSGGGAQYNFETAAQSGPLKELRPIVIGKQCIVGQKSLLGAGAVLEDGASIGLLTNVPAGTHVKSEQVIQGPDARIMTRPSTTVVDRPLPTRHPLWAAPLDVGLWLFLIGLGGSLGGLYVLAFTEVKKLGVHLAVRILLWVGLSIVVQATSVVAVCAAALLVKWLLIGNQKRFSVIKSDDSALTKLLDMHNFVSTILVPTLAGGSLNGTVFGIWFLNLLGAKVSSSAYLHGCFAYDHDWITIGKHAAINRSATISPHNVWEGRGQFGPVEIGPNCTLEQDAVVLPCTMGVGVTIRPRSHPPAHTFLRAGTTWQGVPARVIDE